MRVGASWSEVHCKDVEVGTGFLILPVKHQFVCITAGNPSGYLTYLWKMAHL